MALLALFVQIIGSFWKNFGVAIIFFHSNLARQFFSKHRLFQLLTGRTCSVLEQCPHAFISYFSVQVLAYVEFVFREDCQFLTACREASSSVQTALLFRFCTFYILISSDKILAHERAGAELGSGLHNLMINVYFSAFVFKFLKLILKISRRRRHSVFFASIDYLKIGIFGF